MPVITPQDIFDTCSVLPNGFTYNQVELILGLGKNSLQRLFSTSGFTRLESGGFRLNAVTYGEWSKLCGLTFAPKGALRTTADVVHDEYSEFRAMVIDDVVAALKSGDLNEFRDRLLTGKLTGGVKQYRRTALALLYCVDLAIGDERYELVPESVFSTRRL